MALIVAGGCGSGVDDDDDDAGWASINPVDHTLSAVLTAHTMSSSVYYDPSGVTVHNVRVTHDDLARFAPIVHFHPNERYLPCSMDYVVQGASIYNDVTREVRAVSASNQLDHTLGSANRVQFHSSVLAGEPVTMGRVNAPMYVSIQVPKSGAFVDINYLFFMAYNGPQVAAIHMPFFTYDVTLPSFAEHEGDIEGISVRTSADMRQVLFVRYESHGLSSFYLPDDVEFAGTHPVVLSGLHSHASFNPRHVPKNGRVVHAHMARLGFGVDVSEVVKLGGPRWAPFDTNAAGAAVANGKLQLIGLDENGQPVGGRRWASFGGRLGRTWPNAFAGVHTLTGDKANVAVRSFANLVIRGAIAAGAASQYSISNGTLGWGPRAPLRMTEPHVAPPVDVWPDGHL